MKRDIEISGNKIGENLEFSKHSINKSSLLKVEEVAEILRLKPSTIRAMARRGDLPAIKLGRVWRFRKSSISELIKDQ